MLAGALLAGAAPSIARGGTLHHAGAQSPSPKADPRQALQQAAALVQQGRLEEADQQARMALADPDTQAVACSILGVIRLQQTRLEESAGFFQKAIHLEPRLLGAHLNLAHVYTLQRKPQMALDLFERVLQLDPSNATARIALARSQLEKGNYRRSLALAQPALPAFRQSPDGLLVLATAYLKTGDRQAAAALAQDWVRLADAPEVASIQFALLLAEGSAAPAAIAVLEHAKRAGTPSYELAFNLGGAYLLNNEPARALDAYDLALTNNPQSVPALRQAAAIAERHGELERSLSYWMRARKIQPVDPEILLGFGRVCLKMDLLQDAEPALTEAARLKPLETPYQYALAAAKVGKRQFEAAQALLEPMVARHPQDPHLQYALGSVLYIQGRLDEAAARLKESVRLQPDQLASHYYLALVTRDQGRDAEAIEQLMALLRRHPDHAASAEALGSLLMTAQRYGEAEQQLRTAVRLNPASVRANYQLGLLLARMGRKAEADTQLTLAKSLRAEDAATSRLQLRLLDPDR